jgi:hypothetical protein
VLPINESPRLESLVSQGFLKAVVSLRDNPSLKGVFGDSPHSRYRRPGRSCARHPRTR